MSQDPQQVLVDVQSGETVGPVSGAKGDVSFPPSVRGWSEVLDCRTGRLAEMPLDAVRDFAAHSRKRYVLVLRSEP